MEIREAIDVLQNSVADYVISEYCSTGECKAQQLCENDDCYFIQAIDKVVSEYKRLDEENNDLRKLYRRTAEKLQYNGKDELARYFLAQINECPTFTVNSDIDYYEGYYSLKAKIEKIRNILKEIK